jgi:hypothetical protein
MQRRPRNLHMTGFEKYKTKYSEMHVSTAFSYLFQRCSLVGSAMKVEVSFSVLIPVWWPLRWRFCVLLRNLATRANALPVMFCSAKHIWVMCRTATHGLRLVAECILHDMKSVSESGSWNKAWSLFSLLQNSTWGALIACFLKSDFTTAVTYLVYFSIPSCKATNRNIVWLLLWL